MKNKTFCLIMFLSVVSLHIAGCDRADPESVTEQEISVSAYSEKTYATEQDGVKNPLTGEQLFAVCQACHNLSEGADHKVGPNLYGFIGQPAASRKGYTYSDALSESGLVWNKGLLMGWMLSAETIVPGTWMAYYNHLSIEQTEQLADYIISKTD